MMLAVLTGGNAGTCTSAFDLVGRLTPAALTMDTSPRVERRRIGGHDYVAVCGTRGASR
jgi:hypothetical protein